MSEKRSAPKIIGAEEALAKLRLNSRAADIMYSSVLGGFVTDPALMSIPMDDHMVHRGHGVFDTASLVNGKVWKLNAHMDRLYASMALARVESPMSREEMCQIIVDMCAACPTRRSGSIRYWVTAGPCDFSFSPGSTPSFYAVLFAGLALPLELVTEGIKEVTVSDVPLKPPMLANCKSSNYLLNVLTHMSARDKGGRFGILLEPDGKVAEACVLNTTFVMAGGQVVSPKFDNILSGRTVGAALKMARQLLAEDGCGLVSSVEQRDIYAAEARSCVEMFLSGGDSHIFPVIEWDGVVIGDGKPGPVSRKIIAMIEHDMEAGTEDKIDVPYVL